MWILKQYMYHFHYSNSCEQYEIVTKFGARNFLFCQFDTKEQSP